MPYSSVSYVGNGSTTNFTVTFPFISSSDLHVTVNNVTTSFTLDGTTVTISPAPANGSDIKIYRTTAVDDPVTEFQDGSVFVAGDLNTNFNQFLYAVQELVDDKTDLRSYVDGLLLDSGNMPTPGADGSFIVASSGSWTVMSLAAVQTLLGVSGGGGGVSVPSPSATFKILTANSSTYTLQDAATLKTSLGLTAAASLNLPAGGPFTDLGTAAFVNTGTNPSNVPLISNLGNCAFKTGTDTGGIHSGRVVVLTDNGDAGIGLPTMDGSLLTGIKKMGDYYKVDCKFAYNVHGGVYSGGWQNIKLNYEVLDEITVAAPATDGTITLPAGHYTFRASAKCVGMGLAALKIVTAAGTGLGQSFWIKTNTLDSPSDPVSDAPSETLLSFSGTFILGASTGIRLQIRGTTGDDLSSTQYALGAAHESSALGLNTYATLELWKTR